MLHWILGGGLLWSMFGPKAEEKGAASVGGGSEDPYAKHCPVDAHLPPQGVSAVRTCWLRGSKEELEQFAGALGLEFPIARSSLLGRAYELSVAASRAVQGAGAAKAVASPAPSVKDEKTSVETPKAKAVKRAATKEEIALAEGLAAIKASEQNGKSAKPLAIDVPTEVIDVAGETVG